MWGTSRYSIPFFIAPHICNEIGCSRNCIDEANPKKYEDITAGEFLNQRLKELGLKK